MGKADVVTDYKDMFKLYGIFIWMGGLGGGGFGGPVTEGGSHKKEVGDPVLEEWIEV